MKMEIKKWGHSLALRIPHAFAEQMGLREGSAIEMTGGPEAITLTKPRYSLPDMLAAIAPENRHEASEDGKPVGNEEW